MNSIKYTRDSNIELCRICSIILVVLVHSCFAWNGWPDSYEKLSVPMAFVEAVAVIGVNVFVIISGFFSINLKPTSIINLLFICLFYGVLRILYCILIDGHISIIDFLFVSHSNWFIPTYLLLALISPWLNMFRINRGGVFLMLLLVTLLGYFPGTIEPNPGFQDGYSVLSFVVLYFTARYIAQNINSPQVIKLKNYSVLIYIFCTFLITIECIGVYLILDGRPKTVLFAQNRYVFAYNNPLAIGSSFAFFLAFLKFKIKPNKWINHIAKSVLAVLLIHCPPFNEYMVVFYNYILKSYTGVSLVLLWATGIIVIFSIGVVIDQLRLCIYDKISNKLESKVTSISNKIKLIPSYEK